MDLKQLQTRIQKFGASLSAMVMPNIGIFIGWGVLTALFIPTCWAPNEYFAKLVGSVLTYLLPALIGYTAGYNIYGQRGGVIGGFATMGVIVGANVTMLVGGMVVEPIAAVVLRKFDRAVEGKVKAGLEMLVDNFSLGLIGVTLCVIGYVGVAPVMTGIQAILSAGVNYMTEHHLIPLAALFVQPAQVLFLNNAVNHGIMVPLGLQQAAETGKSILFLVEANGAPWVGLAAAFPVYVLPHRPQPLRRKCCRTALARLHIRILYDDAEGRHVCQYDCLDSDPCKLYGREGIRAHCTRDSGSING